ncbi:cationic peroxidase 1-like [Chenopodium quinoa]|uniref:Peroxidase n=1 Tax=Chenopodium quinoa TaxID=63459 RepID=A0A803MHT0_CHEQI|nr:cationic peroxidase 1-like [Chenopodium quinoa]
MLITCNFIQVKAILNYMAPFASLCMFLLLVLSFTTTTHAQSGLSTNFYDSRCPNFNTIVQSVIRDAIANDQRMGALLLRLHFHDCFVGGCDASILVDIQGGEKQSVHNVGSLQGFDVIDSIKQRVEATCPGVVSCSDIVALAAKESVVALGGPSWNLEFGRRDSTSTPSAGAADTNLPFGSDNVRNLVSLFSRKGFSVREIVALSGAHTLGQARCLRFRDRAYNERNILPAYAQFLQSICPRNGGDNNLGPLDVRSPNAFNNEYFVGLTNFEGLLHSDQVLFTGRGGQTDRAVRLYASNEGAFFNDFAAAMLKMSRLGVQTGNSGTIKSNCRALR